MPVSPARAAAFDILMRVAEQDAYASELLHSEKFRDLSHADHALATQITMGVLRWQSSLDDNLAAVSSQKLTRLDTEVLIALRIGLFQLRFLERVPARAAIFESVELVKRARKRSAVPFVNALLRKAGALPIAPISDKADDAAISHPRPLIHFGSCKGGWRAMARNMRRPFALTIRRSPRRLFIYTRTSWTNEARK